MLRTMARKIRMRGTGDLEEVRSENRPGPGNHSRARTLLVLVIAEAGQAGDQAEDPPVDLPVLRRRGNSSGRCPRILDVLPLWQGDGVGLAASPCREDASGRRASVNLGPLTRPPNAPPCAGTARMSWRLEGVWQGCHSHTRFFRRRPAVLRLFKLASRLRQGKPSTRRYHECHRSASDGSTAVS